MERQFLVTMRGDDTNRDLASALTQAEKPGQQRRGLQWVLKAGPSTGEGTLEIQALTESESLRLAEALNRKYRPLQ